MCLVWPIICADHSPLIKGHRLSVLLCRLLLCTFTSASFYFLPPFLALSAYHLLLLFLDSPPTSITNLSCLPPFSKKLLPPTLDILPNLAQTTIGNTPHSPELLPADFVRIVPSKKHAMLHSVTINVTVHRCQCGATCHCIGSE